VADTKIEWADATWNPTKGCTICAPGCKNCYAMKMAHRLQAMGQKPYQGLTHKVNGHAVWTGKITLDHAALTIPLHKKKPTTYFVNSMSDLFHDGVPLEFVVEVFARMWAAQWHKYIILTKRPERMALMLNWEGFWQQVAQTAWQTLHESEPAKAELVTVADIWSDLSGHRLPHVILGTSISTQADADANLPHLLGTPAYTRIVSAEPLLEAVGLAYAAHPECQHEEGYLEPDTNALVCKKCENETDIGVDGVIVGGESGPGARPCNVEWIRSIVMECQAAGVSVFVKQLGANPVMDGKPYNPHNVYKNDLSGRPMGLYDRKGGDMNEWPADLRVRQLPERLGVMR
jgi:protein gp37